ncbi:MAG: Nif3-like dinuclear metal center hexameric protein [Planctomycetota bacterium]
MKVRDVAEMVEQIASPRWAAEWDNVGLLAGDASAEVTNVLLCVDVTAAVLEEAKAREAELIVAHHPILFKPAAAITAQRTPIVHEAIRAGISLYAAHTNFDAAPGGTNDVIMSAAGVTSTRPIQPARLVGASKIVVFTPASDLVAVRSAAWQAGAGRIGGGYDHCSFAVEGEGTFRPLEGSNPTLGRQGRHEHVREHRLELITPSSRLPAVLAAVREAHSYEEPAIDVFSLEDVPAGVGDGRIGELTQPTVGRAVIESVKEAFGVDAVRLCGPDVEREVTRVACCAGAGRSLLSEAARAGAELFITGEIGHHDAIDAPGRMTIACLGHGASERPAMATLRDTLAGLTSEVRFHLADSPAEPFRTG